MASDEYRLTCDDAAALLVARVEGRVLDARSSGLLDRHLEHCASCRAEAEGQQVVIDVLRSRPVDRLSPSFDKSLATRLDDASGWFGIADWRAWTFRLSPVAALLVLLAFFSAYQTTAPSQIDLNEWVTGSGTGATTSVLQSDISTDALIDTMLSGDSAGQEGGNVR